MNPERELRERLVEHLVDSRILSDPTLVAALRSVPRHAFLPGVSIREAYDDRALAIKARDGVVVSSISQPSMIVQMLQLLQVRDGSRVLEIGTGSGYNAALAATIAGPHGRVVTIDIEADLLELARERFRALQMPNVDAVDASQLEELREGFDRIIVTALAHDVAPAWWRLLEDGGRIVAPLDIGYGGERAIGFVRHGNRLRSVGSHACAFIEMRTNDGNMSGDIFFRDGAHAAAQPNARDRLHLTAIQRADATPEMLAEFDAIVARPATLFGISR